MKKLMTLATVALCTVAMADGIVSSSVVGYTTAAIEADQYYMVAAQFENVGEDAVADLNKIISMSNVSATDYNDMINSAPSIMVRVGENYKFYYYINDAYDGNDPVDGNVWADDIGNLITSADLLALGDGFWFRVPAASCGESASITVAGQVSSASELDKTFTGSATGYYSIIGNPYPTSTDLSKVTSTGLTAVSYEDMINEGNSIMVREGNRYKFYYFINDALDGENLVDGDVWADDIGNLVTDSDKIASGKAFWIKAMQSGKLTFKMN